MRRRVAARSRRRGRAGSGVRGATYCPTIGSTSTKPPVSRASRSSAARSIAATTAAGPSCTRTSARGSSAATGARASPRSAARVDVVDHREGPPHEAAEDPADLRQLERPLHERDERAERHHEQEEPDDHGRHGSEGAVGPVVLGGDRGEREQRVRRGRGGQRQAGDHDRIAAQPRGEPRRVGRGLDLRGDEHRREDDAGERDHAGRQRTEDLLHRGGGDRRGLRPPAGARRGPGARARATTATTFAASTGTHIAEASQMRARRKRREAGTPLTARRPARLGTSSGAAASTGRVAAQPQARAIG